MRTRSLILTLALLAATPALHAQQLQYNFKEWVAAHLEYPQSAYQIMYEASIPVAFKVAADGTIFDVECRADTNHESDIVLEMVDAAVRTVASAPKWQPNKWETDNSDLPAEEYSLMVEFEMPKFARDVKTPPGFLRPDGVSERYHRSHDKLRAWISSQLPSIPNGFRVMLTGVVEKDGTFAHLKAASTSDETIAAEVVRVLEKSPKWTPALDDNGKPVRAFRYVFLYFSNRDYSDYELADSSPDNSDDPNNDHGKRTRASFQGGGVDKFRKWVETHTLYPNNEAFNGIRGDVMLNFAVDRDGNVVEITTLHSPNQALADEVIRVIRNSAPKWTPAKNAVGLPIKSYHTMGMIFYLKGDNKSHLERAGKARRGM